MQRRKSLRHVNAANARWCRAEALEEAASVLSRAAEMLTAYAELVKATGKYAEMHYVPEIEYHAASMASVMGLEEFT